MCATATTAVTGISPRQNIQYNWIKLAELPDALADLAESRIHAMQTSGNCTATSRPIIGRSRRVKSKIRASGRTLAAIFELHPEFSFLPRKFKIRLTGRTTIAPRSRSMTSSDACIRTRGETGSSAGRRRARPHAVHRQTISRSCRGRESVELRRGRSCACTISTAAATTSTRRASRFLVHELGIEKFAQEVESECAADARPARLRSIDAVVEEIARALPYPATRNCRPCGRMKKAAHDP